MNLGTIETLPGIPTSSTAELRDAIVGVIDLNVSSVVRCGESAYEDLTGVMSDSFMDHLHRITHRHFENHGVILGGDGELHADNGVSDGMMATLGIFKFITTQLQPGSTLETVPVSRVVPGLTGIKPGYTDGWPIVADRFFSPPEASYLKPAYAFGFDVGVAGATGLLSHKAKQALHAVDIA